MDFFKEQRLRKQRSFMLYVLFFVIVMIHAVVIGLFFAVIFYLYMGRLSAWLWVLTGVLTALAFAIGSLVELKRLKAGGRAIANRVGAVRLFVDNSSDAMTQGTDARYASVSEHDPSPAPNVIKDTESRVRYTKYHIAVRDAKDFPLVYRRYYNFAHQLAIAAGIRVPVLYVLPNEFGINAFVAGYTAKDMVMVVTQGALDKLSDEGLYGLISHQYSHILHDDNRFNLRLMVVLAGLQLLYDISDPRADEVRQGGYFDMVANQGNGMAATDISQASIDARARQIEAQTQDFKTSEQWVSYWRGNHQAQKAVKTNDAFRQHVRPFTGSVFLHLMTSSSMACAQFIKHSFSVQRELLADATSLQLTRSNAIVETLKCVINDPIGSRLTATPNINGLSHFFFAESGTDFFNTSIFATHPSINKRLESIHQGEYAVFAAKVAEKKRINGKKVAQIRAQMRKGTWQAFKQPNTASHAPVEYDEEADDVVDGRLDTQSFKDKVAEQTGANQPLAPYQAKPIKQIAYGEYVQRQHLKHINLPREINERLFTPLGLVAIIESVMLCHAHQSLSPTSDYDLMQIWQGGKLATPVLPHTLNRDLLTSIASLDRRLDSVLIEIAIRRLQKMNIAKQIEADLAEAELPKGGDISLHHHDLAAKLKLQKQKEQNKKSYVTLRKYQQGLVDYLSQLDLSQCDQAIIDDGKSLPAQKESNKQSAPKHKNTNNSSLTMPLWQALHLMQLISALSAALGASPQILTESALVKRLLGQRIYQHYDNYDAGDDKPSDDGSQSRASTAQIVTYSNANRSEANQSGNDQAIVPAKISLLLLIMQMLQMQFATALSCDEEQKFKMSLQRLARLTDIPIWLVDDFCQNWLHHYLKRNECLDIFELMGIIHHLKMTHPSRGDWQKRAISWLNTFYTAVLHDGVVSQDEYDVLTLLAQEWLGTRQLVQ